MRCCWTESEFIRSFQLSTPILAGLFAEHDDFKVWHLRITVHFLADDGNMLDCACLAAIVALKHFRRPEVEVIGDEVNVVRLIPSAYILFSF